MIVCLSPARIARKKERRGYALTVAEKYGFEFRFADHAETHGKLPEGFMRHMEEFKDDLFDEQEAIKITQRTTPGRLARHELGLPHGGRTGPLYGYAEGERRYKITADGRQGAPKGLLTWIVDEEKAQHIRWLFQQVDERDQSEVCLRSLARELDTRAPTATGRSLWSTKQVGDLLRNGKYAGLGRNLRYETVWGQYTDDLTGEVRDDFRTQLRDLDKTFAVSVSAIPPIIDAEQFIRVQAKLDKLKEQNWRGGPRRTDAEAHSTLLDGFVRCAHCNGKMARYWDHRREHPYYKCARGAGIPNHECKPHAIRASAVDALALKLLAHVLTDPEKILQLAEASDQRHQYLSNERELAHVHLASTEKQLAELADQRAKVVTAINALSAVDGMTDQIAELRVRLQHIDTDRAIP